MRGLLYLSLAFSLCSCSLPYQWKWQQSLKHTASSPKDISGAWQGHWQSSRSSHQGKLKAIVTAGSTPEEWQFHYHATWAKIISGRFKVLHRDQNPQPQQYRFLGQHSLGPLYGGTYSFDGSATPLQFEARYHHAVDEGVFQLYRVKL